LRSRQKDIISLLVVLILVIGSLYLVFTTPPKLGLDLRGGMNVVLTAEEPDKSEVSEDAIAQAKLIIEERVNALGVAEPQIERQINSPNIIVQLPGVKDAKRALDIIGATAQLEFREVLNSGSTNTAGEPELGPVLMTGDALQSASVAFDQLGKPKVNMSFTPEGARDFERITGELQGKQLAIVLDGKVMSAPNVNQQITGGNAEITGQFTLDEVRKVVLVLNTGALPVDLKVSSQQVVGPSLGQDSLDDGIRAGIVGFALVVIFLLLNYRGLALVSIVGLFVFGSIFAGALTAIGATLTLPGIAGIIMTIGLASDSSIVFFERFKEEVRKGKTSRSAAGQGFKFAFRTIIDADAVSLIIAVTMIALSYLYFGSGPIRGFAFTLSIGTLTDIFTAFFFTRPAIQRLSELSIFSNPTFIGVSKDK